MNRAERAVLRTARSGEPIDIVLDQRDRPIRAHVLADLLTRRRGNHALRLTGATITGPVDLTGSRLDFPVELRECHFDEPVRLAEAQLGSLRLPGCRLPHLDYARQLRTSGAVELNEGFTARVDLAGARIDGHLSLDSAHLTGDADHPGIDAERTLIEQGVFGRETTVDGEMRLSHARISGPVVLDESRLRNPGRRALNTEYSTIDSQFSMRDLVADGEVHLVGSRISGDLGMPRARLNTPNALALSADSLTVDRSLMCSGLVANGAVNLIGAQIGGALAFVNTTVRQPHGWALLLIETDALLLTLRLAPESEGAISLRDGRFGRLTDDPPHWPEKCTIELTGTHYQRVTQRNTDVEPCPIGTRLKWMHQHSITTPSAVTDPAAPATFSPAPYAQLAAALQRDGFDQDARRVQRFKERRRHRAMGPLGACWGALQDITVGFGHRPALALAWLTGLLASGTTYFSVAGPVTAVKKGESPTWDPFLYSLDLLIPLVDLGHDKAWDPTGWSKAVALALIISGWVLATTVVAGAGRVLNRS
ncbi:hypothetical protein E1161_08115 [Saccharopolyspora aridisoli]|uniref:Oxidoreductase n=1 Tax=Saccharopolyspora aridisoli TaxID=2530385 RepID=A0A4R4V005_9PSEU|nr:hypothetical protein [Saccharopolyspora aridisoli]TDC94483.1 hypothetical protein E1161_08115 [Saccharopolyspora aridisoli]